MNPGFSLYLDLLRFGAALLVLIYHSNNRMIVEQILPFSQHGHAAVMVFFVLSGYVIAHVTEHRERTPAEYWSSRLSRFYVLTLPMVLLTPLLDMVGQAYWPEIYAGATTHDLTAVRIGTSLLYLNEVWQVSIMCFSNVPYWSINYEMWYYALFAMVVFTRGRLRLALLAGSAALLGPKILLLAPVWALGVLLQRWRKLERITPTWGALLWFSSIVGVALFQHYDMTERGSELLRQWIGNEAHRQLAFSKFFLGDYLLAPLIAVHFAGARAIGPMLDQALRRWAGPIRWLAAYTFALYLMHQPLLLFFAALIHGDPKGYVFYVEVVAAVLLTVWAGGTLTEHWRGQLRQRMRGALLALGQTRWWRNTLQPALRRSSG
jgi:peptidoglycan/LPS O-acetylase OafA/YrhL